MATQVNETGKKLQEDLKESARKIWLAGLGALATAEEQGTKLFQSLTERGEEFEARGEKHFAKVKEKVMSAAGKAEQQWSRLEATIEEKVNAAVQRVGVPSRDEVKALTRRVEELTAKVEQLRPAKKSSGSKSTKSTKKAASK